MAERTGVVARPQLSLCIDATRYLEGERRGGVSWPNAHVQKTEFEVGRGEGVLTCIRRGS